MYKCVSGASASAVIWCAVTSSLEGAGQRMRVGPRPTDWANARVQRSQQREVRPERRLPRPAVRRQRRRLALRGGDEAGEQVRRGAPPQHPQPVQPAGLLLQHQQHLVLLLAGTGGAQLRRERGGEELDARPPAQRLVKLDLRRAEARRQRAAGEAHHGGRGSSNVGRRRCLSVASANEAESVCERVCVHSALRGSGSVPLVRRKRNFVLAEQKTVQLSPLSIFSSFAYIVAALQHQRACKPRSLPRLRPPLAFAAALAGASWRCAPGCADSC